MSEDLLGLKRSAEIRRELRQVEHLLSQTIWSWVATA